MIELFMLYKMHAFIFYVFPSYLSVFGFDIFFWLISVCFLGCCFPFRVEYI